MTLADFRGVRKAAEPEQSSQETAHREGTHPGPMEYIQIGLALSVLTLIEVAVYYIEALEDVLIPMLLVLSATKFSMVVLWFMHLKFDSRVFSTLFVGGLALAVGR